MGQDTKIAWATDTVNPWYGCSEVSEACRHCYARGWAKRCGRTACWGEQGQRVVRVEKALAECERLNRLAEKAGVRRNVFVCSLGDFFEDRPELVEARRSFLLGVAKLGNLTFLLLTKRPANVGRMMGEALPDDEECACCQVARFAFGTTAENQARWNERVPVIVEAAREWGVPSFVSVEPMLGQVCLAGERPDWVIVGCLKVAGRCPKGSTAWWWARELVRECLAEGIPVFVKQWLAGPWDSWVVEDSPTWPKLFRTRQLPWWMVTGTGVDAK